MSRSGELCRIACMWVLSTVPDLDMQRRLLKRRMRLRCTIRMCLHINNTVWNSILLAGGWRILIVQLRRNEFKLFAWEQGVKLCETSLFVLIAASV
jgi:hypothetical protein